MAEPRILNHIEQSTATAITFEGNYVSVYNTDAVNSMTFNLTSKETGNDLFSSDITVLAGEVWSNFTKRFTEVTFVNGDSCPIIVDVGV